MFGIKHKLDLIIANQETNLSYLRKIMANIDDFNAEIQKLVDAEKAESARVAALQTTLLGQLADLKAQLAGGAAGFDTTPQIAALEGVVAALTNTDPAPAPVAPAPAP